jgi:O-acetyl-ADP-ribose deacetylase (regulator of RNase III)
MTAGAAASVKRHGGEEIERAAVDQGPIHAGAAVVTTGGTLVAPYVIHAVGVGHDRVADPAVLATSIRSALAFAEPLRLRRIAVAMLGTEHGTFAAEEAARIVVTTLLAEATSTPIEAVVLATAYAPEARAFGDALAAARGGARIS